MRRLFFLVFGLMITCNSIAGCGSNSSTTDLGEMDPNEEMGTEDEVIKPVNVPASEV